MLFTRTGLPASDIEIIDAFELYLAVWIKVGWFGPVKPSAWQAAERSQIISVRVLFVLKQTIYIAITEADWLLAWAGKVEAIHVETE